MATTWQSFELQQGQDKVLRFTVTDNDGDNVDFAGASGRFVAGRNRRSTTFNLDSDASPQTAVVALSTASPLDGLVTVTLTDTVLDALVGDYYYELKITDSAGNESVAARGWISLSRSIS